MENDKNMNWEKLRGLYRRYSDGVERMQFPSAEELSSLLDAHDAAKKSEEKPKKVALPTVTRRRPVMRYAAAIALLMVAAASIYLLTNGRNADPQFADKPLPDNQPAAVVSDSTAPTDALMPAAPSTIAQNKPDRAAAPSATAPAAEGESPAAIREEETLPIPTAQPEPMVVEQEPAAADSTTVPTDTLQPVNKARHNYNKTPIKEADMKNYEQDNQALQNQRKGWRTRKNKSFLPVFKNEDRDIHYNSNDHQAPHTSIPTGRQATAIVMY